MLALYQGWGNAPGSWSPGVNQGLSYCAWDTGSILCDDNGRVIGLCAGPSSAVRVHSRALAQHPAGGAATAVLSRAPQPHAARCRPPQPVPVPSLVNCEAPAAFSAPAVSCAYACILRAIAALVPDKPIAPPPSPSSSPLLHRTLSGAGLGGTISPALGSLPLLQQLDLSGNSISGGLPAEIGNNVMLQSLCACPPVPRTPARSRLRAHLPVCAR